MKDQRIRSEHQPPVAWPGTVVLVALGSNLGDSKQVIHHAMEQLSELASEAFLRSSLWTSTPVDCPPGSPLFVNAAVAFTPTAGETADTLLLKLQALEIEFGRKPKEVLNEARPLDLDLIAFGMERRLSPALTLPHPRAHLRRFVLEPLNEIAPNVVLPGQQKPIHQLRSELVSDEVVERAP